MEGSELVKVLSIGKELGIIGLTDKIVNKHKISQSVSTEKQCGSNRTRLNTKCNTGCNTKCNTVLFDV